MCELCLRKLTWLEPELFGGGRKGAPAGKDETSEESPPLPAPASPSDVVLDAPSPYVGSPTSGLPSSGDVDVDNLLATAKWGGAVGSGVVITYSFPPFDAVWKTGYGSNEPATFQPLSATQQAAVRDALELWSDLANITFVEVQETASEVGTIRFGRSDAPSTAWAYYPSNGYPEGGDVWLGPNYGANASYAPGTYNFATLVHEIGHAIGLKHPHSNGGSGVIYPTSADWLGNSVMSYRSYIGDSLSGGYSNAFFPTTPMLNDVAALQYIYGVNLQTRSGDTTYAWAPGQRLFETIYDAGGVDTIDWSNQSSAAVIDLNPGAWSELGPAYTWFDGTGGSYNTTVAIARGSWIENAKGGSGADRITGNSLANRLEGNSGSDSLFGGAGADSLLGGDGDDSLVGGAGDDRLWGGAGNDSFIFAGGFGDDFVHDTQGSNRLVLSDLAQGSVTFVNVGGDLLIEVIGRTDSILVDDYFSSALVYDFIYGSAAPTTLVGTGGSDSLSGTAGSDTIWGNGGADQIYGLGGDDTAYGGTGNDSLFGGDGLDRLLGDGGNDRLHGGAGRDVMSGGGGADIFDFDLVSDSRPGAGQRDVITDFKTKQSDRIDLAGIDARPGTVGDDAFVWRGTSGFSADATGQLRYFKSGGVTVIQGSTDADADPEFEIELTGSITLQSSHFFL